MSNTLKMQRVLSDFHFDGAFLQTCRAYTGHDCHLSDTF